MKANFPVRLIGAWIVLLLLSAASLPAATTTCAPLKQVLAAFDAQYLERVLFQGTNRHGVQTIITATSDGSTWTVLQVTGTTACLIAGGDKWIAGPQSDVETGTEG